MPLRHVKEIIHGVPEILMQLEMGGPPDAAKKCRFFSFSIFSPGKTIGFICQKKIRKMLVSCHDVIMFVSLSIFGLLHPLYQQVEIAGILRGERRWHWNSLSSFPCSILVTCSNPHSSWYRVFHRLIEILQSCLRFYQSGLPLYQHLCIELTRTYIGSIFIFICFTVTYIISLN